MMTRRFFAGALASTAAGFLAFASGCGGETENRSVEPDAAAKKAEQYVQDSMRKTMESKSSKGKSKSKPADN